jgi:hypothetical protein
LGVTQVVMGLLNAPTDNVLRPIMRGVGNMTTGDDEQTQKLIDAGLLDKLKVLITQGKKFARKDALWCLSNITAGNRAQCLSVLRHSLLLDLVLAMKDCDLELRKEAMWALANLVTSIAYEEVKELVEMGVLETINESLQYKDPGLLLVALEAVSNILEAETKDQVGASRLEFRQRFEDIGGLNTVETLQSHPNFSVYEHTAAVLTRYFSVEEVTPLGDPPSISHYQFS